MYLRGVEDGNDEPETIAAARHGDPAAWDALYRALYPRLRSFLVRRVGPGDADDAASETMSRAVAGIGRYREGPAGFDGWVFGIARHVAADHVRRTARRAVPVPSGIGGRALDEPAELLLAGDERADLRRAFALLSRREQELLELRVIAGLSAEQTAAVLGKRAGAVRTAQSRALAHLRDLLSVNDG